MTRTALLIALLAALGATGAPMPAFGDPGVAFVWTATTGTGSTGGDTIDADVGDLLTLRVFVTPDANDVSFASLSFSYDPALLAVDAHAECPHAGSTPAGSNLIAGLCDDGAFHFLAPQAAGMQDDDLAGELASADAATFGSAVATGALEIAAIGFEVLVADDTSVDVFYEPGLDSVNDVNGELSFPAASATLLPEPGATAALGCGAALVGLLALRRARRRLATTAVLLVALGGVSASAQDADGDGILDADDNCKLVANAGPLFCDTDQDGYGNACDADYDDDGVQADPDDAATFTANYGFAPGSLEPDHDCDGVVGGPDHGVHYGNRGDPVGPSGLACAGSPTCP